MIRPLDTEPTSRPGTRHHGSHGGVTRAVRATLLAAFAVVIACRQQPPPQRTFATPEQAVKALVEAANKGSLEELLAIFGLEGRELVASSDPATASRNHEVFVVAAAERVQLIDQGTNGETLVVGFEEWPFPVPLVKVGSRWHFDTAAGKQEIIARRIGRNELAAIRLCRVYVQAQRVYAQRGHDGRPAGIYATTFRSDPNRENGLYWPAVPGRKRSPLGDLVAQAALDPRPRGVDNQQPSPFHGYYFRILTSQGPDARGGAKTYLTGQGMTAGFALMAWPAKYDITGVMTFLVNHEGVVRQKDLGLRTADEAGHMPHYDPDMTWTVVSEP